MRIGIIGARNMGRRDAGPLAESWRQQPGTPGYTTDRSTES